MAYTRIKAVVNIYKIGADTDDFIEQSFSNAVNDAVEELEDQDCKIMRIGLTTLSSENKFIKNADILYTFEEKPPTRVQQEEVEEEKVEEQMVRVAPTVGSHPRKVTEDVFDFVHLMNQDQCSVDEIADEFNGKLSIFTVRKILNTKSYSDYYSA